MVYLSYSYKMEKWFAKIIELGSKGKKSSPLMLEEFSWENALNNLMKVIAANLWIVVDEAFITMHGLRGQNLPNSANAATAATSSQRHQTYVTTRKHPRNAAVQDIWEDDDNDHQDDGPTLVEQPLQVESSRPIEGSESGGGGVVDDVAAFHLDEDLLL
jgi:hypothetical protein